MLHDSNIVHSLHTEINKLVLLTKSKHWMLCRSYGGGGGGGGREGEPNGKYVHVQEVKLVYTLLRVKYCTSLNLGTL